MAHQHRSIREFLAIQCIGLFVRQRLLHRGEKVQNAGVSRQSGNALGQPEVRWQGCPFDVGHRKGKRPHSYFSVIG